MEAMSVEEEQVNSVATYEETEQNTVNYGQQYYDLDQFYSPATHLPLKKLNSVISFDLDPEINLFKGKASLCEGTKEQSYDSLEESYTQKDSELDYLDGDLERLVNSIGKESLKITYVPSRVEVNELWDKLQPRFTPSENQELFLSQYLEKDQILNIKFGIDNEILHSQETLAFEQWVEGLCVRDNGKIVRELARRQKVKKYLKKKQGRTFLKKVHYQIRQRVAEERLRVKGRFVTWGQALSMLNETNKRQYNLSDYYQIKNKLTAKYGSCKSKC